MPAFKKKKKESSEFAGARYEARAKRELGGWGVVRKRVLLQFSPGDRGRKTKATVESGRNMAGSGTIR